ncbi:MULTISPECIES: hypothetical protein [unclassified Streptomyces]|uniref:hypothetical protein n=1 Tax=unclassified Streptomyces TaxID=2593676 RepID=UPI000A67642C|nr:MULTISPECIES: hypothetical protein [unclassified Streptomyces]
MTDDEKADVLRDAIDAYLGEVHPDDLDSDDLSWVLVTALDQAEKKAAAQH